MDGLIIVAKHWIVTSFKTPANLVALFAMPSLLSALAFQQIGFVPGFVVLMLGGYIMARLFLVNPVMELGPNQRFFSTMLIMIAIIIPWLVLAQQHYPFFPGGGFVSMVMILLFPYFVPQSARWITIERYYEKTVRPLPWALIAFFGMNIFGVFEIWIMGR